MDSQIRVQTGTWKVKVILGLGGLTVLVILAYLYRFEIGLILSVIGGMLAIRLGFWVKARYTWEKMQARKLAALTHQAEAEARMTHWRMKQEQATAQKMAYDALFIERRTGTFVIGNLPFAFYPSATASKELATGQPPLALPAPSLDFFQVMSDPAQAYAIVGPQRIGKSVMAQHLAQYLTGKGTPCIVVGTKAQPGEWLNCKRFIGNEQVPIALSSLLAEIKGRIEASANAPKLAVFLDDWLNSVALDPNLSEQFFLEAATRILTAGIVPYFLLQSDSKADWGTKHGAQLKNNFVHLLLNAPRENGRLNYNRLRATIIYPGEKEQHSVTLPAGLPTFGEADPSINSGCSIELAAPEAPTPTEQERQILELAESGASLNVIARQVYGGIGGKQNQLIKDVLAKYGNE